MTKDKVKRDYFHGSVTPGIKELHAVSKDHTSSEKAVYLTNNRTYALFYIWDAKNEYKYITGGVRNGVVFYEEWFPNQLSELYRGVKGFIYHCVCDAECKITSMREGVDIINQSVRTDIYEVIEDVYEEIMKCEKEGLAEIKRFTKRTEEEQKKMIDMIAQYIVEQNLLSSDSAEAKFLSTYHTEAWERARRM